MNYKIDEGNSLFPEIKKMNDSVTRIYFDLTTYSKQGEDGQSVVIYTSKYIDVDYVPKSVIDGLKNKVISEITEYDSSNAVNEFFVNNSTLWLDSATRDKLAKRLEIDRKSGLTITKVIYNGIVLELPIEKVELMLFQLELYARDCFDNTNRHISNILDLNNITSIVEYDYTTGYPEKLNFNI